MSLTNKQIYDLNNAMSANQNASVGTLLSDISGSFVDISSTVDEISGSLVDVSSTVDEISGSLVYIDGFVMGNFKYPYVAGFTVPVSDPSFSLSTEDIFGDPTINFMGVVCSLSGSPVANHCMSTATISGSIVTINQWRFDTGSFVASASASDFASIALVAYGVGSGRVPPSP